ncbi:MAG TPA: hypothetical protein HA250_02575 [Nanoarchaeota archaeon]|nr:hypothetical protein [Nanoarchaeota archaeon]HIH34792.1 hypothetical protein [Nanoarchaeota archaeon]HIH51222.1 hypothetical protein [Nanoarchaeota archaeon]
MVKKVILLYKEFGDNIITRDTFSHFFERINSSREKEIVIDFKKVGFISRSCADEYLKLKKRSEKSIVERNLSNEVKSMFKVVEYQLREANFSFTPKNPANVLSIPA